MSRSAKTSPGSATWASPRSSTTSTGTRRSAPRTSSPPRRPPAPRRSWRASPPESPDLGGGAGGVREGGGDPVQGRVVVRGRQEPGLVRGRRQVDAVLQRGVEERGVPLGVLQAGAVEVADLVRREEDREQVAGGLQPVFDAFLG